MWRINRDKMILVKSFVVLVLVAGANWSADAAKTPPHSLALPGCLDTCGNVTNIPYPFGIGPGCFLGPRYEIDCQQNRSISTPVLKYFDMVVLEIHLPPDSESPGHMRVSQPISRFQTNQQNVTTVSLMGDNWIFRYFPGENYFVAGGCDIQALMAIDHSAGEFIGCKSPCSRNGTFGLDKCLRNDGCCMIQIPNFIVKPSVEINPLHGKARASGNAQDAYAFVVEAAWLFHGHMNSLPTHVPVLLEWAITPHEEELLSNQINRRHKDKSGSCQRLGCSIRMCDGSNRRFSCEAPRNATRISCACNRGYEGNYFLPQGCQDIDECKLQHIKCRGKCVNTRGSHRCIDKKIDIMIAVYTGFGVALLGLLSWWSYKFIKRRRAEKLKQKFFKRNGGLLLQQRLSSIEDSHAAKGKLFTSTELHTATDHFNENRILGQGGQGTVYKGMLTDGTIIAVKKSKVVHAGLVEQFVNEVVILSGINHRNVVKLLGFCLESEVPLLVYEFVPNGTLYQYLHNPFGGSPMTWEMRLRIASEVAGALSYLHFTAAIPIYHRDIKSSNILLDEKYRANVADFGASRSITIDQTHLTTKVQGTFGYLDPEYFQSSQFTDKSDVYSFGVVLVELLTREKPISQLRSEEGKSLVMYFIISMDESRLFDVLDKEVLDHGEKDEIIDVSNLAKRCLNLNGRYRPTMKEVAMELERVQSLRNPMIDWQNGREIDHIRTGSVCSSGAVSASTQSEADVEAFVGGRSITL